MMDDSAYYEHYLAISIVCVLLQIVSIGGTLVAGCIIYMFFQAPLQSENLREAITLKKNFLRMYAFCMDHQSSLPCETLWTVVTFEYDFFCMQLNNVLLQAVL